MMYYFRLYRATFSGFQVLKTDFRSMSKCSNGIKLNLSLKNLKVTLSLAPYVTGYWKTDYNVTLGQLHFIGPANSHTHALSMHCCITGLS